LGIANNLKTPELYDVNEEINTIIQNEPEELTRLMKTHGIKLPERKFDSNRECDEYLQSFDMGIVFNLGHSFCCIFHDDKSPSASIHKCDDKEQYFYMCHSSNCRYSKKPLSILQFVQAVSGQNFMWARRFLWKAFLVKVGREEEIYNMPASNNEEMLELEAEKLCPTAIKIMGKQIEVLKALYEIEQQIVEKANYSCSDIVISESNKYIQSIINKNLNKPADNENIKISKWLGILSYFGFIRRLKLNEIYTDRYQRLLQHAKENDNNRFINQIQVYALTEDRLKQIEINAIKWKQSGYSIDNFNYEIVYQIEGPFRAHDIYPQKFHCLSNNKNGIDKLSENITQVLNTRLENSSWIFVKNLKDELIKERDYTPTGLRRYFMPALEMVLKNTEYKIIKVNKSDKARLSITCSGYPEIIQINDKLSVN